MILTPLNYIARNCTRKCTVPVVPLFSHNPSVFFSHRPVCASFVLAQHVCMSLAYYSGGRVRERWAQFFLSHSRYRPPIVVTARLDRVRKIIGTLCLPSLLCECLNASRSLFCDFSVLMCTTTCMQLHLVRSEAHKLMSPLVVYFFEARDKLAHSRKNARTLGLLFPARL